MKKLKLNLQNIEGVELLTKVQLKNVLGGDDGITVDPGGTGCGSDGDCSAGQKCCKSTDGGIQMCALA